MTAPKEVLMEEVEALGVRRLFPGELLTPLSSGEEPMQTAREVRESTRTAPRAKVGMGKKLVLGKQ